MGILDSKCKHQRIKQAGTAGVNHLELQQQQQQDAQQVVVRCIAKNLHEGCVKQEEHAM